MLKKETKKECECEKEKSNYICDSKEAKIEELTNDLKRIQADFDNYQKRTEKQNNEFREYASARLIDELLPVLDSLEQGVKHNKDFVQVYEQLFSILKKNGLEKIDMNVGDNFDHDLMDCLMQETNPKLKEGKVAQVLSTGYKLKGKILRTTKISINKLNESSKTVKGDCEKENNNKNVEKEK